MYVSLVLVVRLISTHQAYIQTVIMTCMYLFNNSRLTIIVKQTQGSFTHGEHHTTDVLCR